MGAIVIGSITYITRSHFEKPPNGDKKGSIIVLITVIAALLSFYAIYNWNSAAKLIEETQTIHPQVDIEKSVEAVSRNPNEPYYRTIHAKNLLRFLQKQPDRSNRDEIIRQIKISLKTAQALDRWRLETYYSASEIYTSLDQFYPNMGYSRQATKYMLQAQEIAPQNQFTYLNTANIYFIQGKTDSALEELSKAIEIDAEYWQAHLFRANLLLSQNKLEQAKETATMVIEKSEAPQYQEAAQNILLLIELAERTKQE
jgi:tetratricopeptide (TPR) repeat protein